MKFVVRNLLTWEIKAAQIVNINETFAVKFTQWSNYPKCGGTNGCL